MMGAVALPGFGITGHLTGNGRWRDGPHTKAALSRRGNSNSVLKLKLLESGRCLHGHTLHEKVLHFIFEAAVVPSRLSCQDPFHEMATNLTAKTGGHLLVKALK